MNSNKSTKKPIAEVLRKAATYHQGIGRSFWEPENSYPDLGYTIGAGIRPADSKIVKSDKEPKHKGDQRLREFTSKNGFR